MSVDAYYTSPLRLYSLLILQVFGKAERESSSIFSQEALQTLIHRIQREREKSFFKKICKERKEKKHSSCRRAYVATVTGSPCFSAGWRGRLDDVGDFYKVSDALLSHWAELEHCIENIKVIYSTLVQEVTKWY